MMACFVIMSEVFSAFVDFNNFGCTSRSILSSAGRGRRPKKEPARHPSSLGVEVLGVATSKTRAIRTPPDLMLIF